MATATLLTEGQGSLSKLEQPAAVYAALEDYVRLLFAFAKDSGDSDFPSLAVEHLLGVCTSPEVLASMARQLWEQARLSLRTVLLSPSPWRSFSCSLRAGRTTSPRW